MSVSELLAQAAFTPEMRVNADIIVRQFANAGLGSGIALAAVVNAYAESQLDPLVCFGRTPWGADRAFGPIGGQENSCGLFQLNAAPGAAGEGMTVEQRQSAEDNTARILAVAQGPSGENLRAASRDNAPLGRLIYLFTVDIERPADSASKGNERSELARDWWGDAVDEPSDNLPQLAPQKNASLPFFLAMAGLLALLVVARR